MDLLLSDNEKIVVECFWRNYVTGSESFEELTPAQMAHIYSKLMARLPKYRRYKITLMLAKFECKSEITYPYINRIVCFIANLQKHMCNGHPNFLIKHLIRTFFYIAEAHPEVITTEVLDKLLNFDDMYIYKMHAICEVLNAFFIEGEDIKHPNERNPYVARLSAKSRAQIKLFDDLVEANINNEEDNEEVVNREPDDEEDWEHRGREIIFERPFCLTNTFLHNDEIDRNSEHLLVLRSAQETRVGNGAAVKRVPPELAIQLATMLENKKVDIIF